MDIHSARPWTQFAWVNRQLFAMVQQLIDGSALAAGQRLLDYGCAQRPYEGMVPPGVEYVGADLPGNPAADLNLRDDGTVPAPDGSFDAVLSTQVLEHVADPERYLSECARVLKPGGSLLLSTHGIMYYHRDPEDYWRWTSYGLATIVAAAGLEVTEARGVLGLAAAGLQLFQDAVQGHVPRIFRRAFFFVMQGLIYLFDRRQADQQRVDNGLVIAVRAVRLATAAAGGQTS